MRSICPDCGSPLRIRTSKKVTSTARIIFHECTNFECGAKFSGSFSIDRRIVITHEGKTSMPVEVVSSQQLALALNE